jgi:serine/threonine-protein kinase RsbW
MYRAINFKGLPDMNEIRQDREYMPQEIALDLPANYTYLSVISACIAAMLERVEGITDRNSVTYQVQLAVHEACTNIVEHAYAGEGGRILLIFSYIDETRRFLIQIRDSGKSFQLSGYQQPNLGEAQVSGYGLFLIHQLMDEVTYFPLQGENEWRLVKNLMVNNLSDK